MNPPGRRNTEGFLVLQGIQHFSRIQNSPEWVNENACREKHLKRQIPIRNRNKASQCVENPGKHQGHDCLVAQKTWQGAAERGHTQEVSLWDKRVFLSTQRPRWHSTQRHIQMYESAFYCRRLNRGLAGLWALQPERDSEGLQVLIAKPDKRRVGFP